MKRINTLFKQAARHNKPWRYDEYMKKINNIRPASYKFIRKQESCKKNLLTEQVSNRRTRNNRNHNNQPDAAEEVSAEKFHYEELTPEQVVALHQERWIQHLDDGLNRWGIMTSNGSESLNSVFRIARLLVCNNIEVNNTINLLYKALFMN
jgi:hypothetical protein